MLEVSQNKTEIKVLALVGSLRAASINRKIAELAASVAPENVSITLFEGLKDLPFYNEEIDNTMTADAPQLAPVIALRAAAGEADAARHGKTSFHAPGFAMSLMART